MKADESDLQFKILMAEREHFSLGGNKRICYTLPPLIFQAYQLALIYSGKREQVCFKKQLHILKIVMYIFQFLRMNYGRKNVEKYSNSVIRLF